MARETKTIQCYPDDDIINRRVKEYESFGWELINNQRCQEYEGQSSEYNFDGTTTKYNNYSTFNKLTFSRDKSASWYSEVVALENEYNDKEKEIDRLKRQKPDEPTYYKTAGSVFINYMSVLFILVGFALILISAIIRMDIYITLPMGITMAVLGILRFVIRKIRRNSDKKRYESALYRWKRDNDEKIKNIKKECDSIMAQAESVVNS